MTSEKNVPATINRHELTLRTVSLASSLLTKDIGVGVIMMSLDKNGVPGEGLRRAPHYKGMMSAVDRHFPFEPLRFFMTQSWARPTLAKYRPTATLLGLRTISGEVVGFVASQDGTPVFPFLSSEHFMAAETWL